MKKSFWILVLVFCVSLYGCSEGREKEIVEESAALPNFKASVQLLEKQEAPDNLPGEIGSFEDGTAETEWVKAVDIEKDAQEESAETDQDNSESGSNQGIYINQKDYSSFYILWKDDWFRVEWKTARMMEAELRAAVRDFDQDGEEELAVVLCPDGGTHWAREELHILEKNRDGKWQDAAFPLDAYEDWVLEQAKLLPGAKLVFMDESLKLELSEENGVDRDMTELADTLYLITVELEDDKAMVEAVLDPADIASKKSLAVVSTIFGWDGEYFQTLNYELRAWE